MYNMKLIVSLILCVLAGTQAREGFGPGDQDWGYVTVREGAHMFWWLFFTTADVAHYTEKPLIVWLQGGPGASSTGYGNFAELGPLDLNLEPREHTWVKDANVIFVDNPVGTGFSYVESPTQLTTTNKEIADDFVELLRGFYEKYPEFKTVPFYIVSESYGGKMTIEIASVLDTAIKGGSIESNFIGVGLGDSWLEPVTIVQQWAPYLWSVGAVDQRGRDNVQAAADLTKELFEQGRYVQSTNQWGTTEYVIWDEAANIDFYNILTPIRARGKSYRPLAKPEGATRDEEDEILERIMAQVRESLGLEAQWGVQSNAVFSTLSEDFMKPVTQVTEYVLDNTDVKVAVFNGQLDLIVCTPGIVLWLDSLQWSKTSEWLSAPRPPFAVNGYYEGFEKHAGNLAMYWVNRAGHMVPSDNPAAMDYILRKLTNDYDGNVKRA
nr:retinoid-inducible serine carboxypeptidase-like [Onthophagus taurus]